MKIQMLVVLALLGLGLPAAAEFTTITAAYEVALSDLRLPGTTSGTLTFKQCPECASETVRVTSGTRYVLDGRDLNLMDFKAQLQAVRNPREEIATVLHHLESNSITAVKVRL